MSTYKVWICSPSGDQYFDCSSFEEALQLGIDARDTGRGGSYASVRVIGDGYDCDCDQDGYYECSDGLTDDERERVEEVGLI